MKAVPEFGGGRLGGGFGTTHNPAYEFQSSRELVVRACAPARSGMGLDGRVLLGAALNSVRPAKVSSELRCWSLFESILLLIYLYDPTSSSSCNKFSLSFKEGLYRFARGKGEIDVMVQSEAKRRSIYPLSSITVWVEISEILLEWFHAFGFE